MLHLVIEPEKAKALSAKAMLEPRLGVHLRLQQHHGPLSVAGLRTFRPSRPIETMDPTAFSYDAS